MAVQAINEMYAIVCIDWETYIRVETTLFVACVFVSISDYRPAEAQTIRSYVRYLIKRHGFTCMFRGLPLTMAR